MSWVTVTGINIKIVYPPANMKHTGFMARTLQLALPEGAESWSRVHTTGDDVGTGNSRDPPLHCVPPPTRLGWSLIWQPIVVLHEWELCWCFFHESTAALPTGRQSPWGSHRVRMSAVEWKRDVRHTALKTTDNTRTQHPSGPPAALTAGRKQ